MLLFCINSIDLKEIKKYFILLLLCLPNIGYSVNHALIVAVGDYPQNNGWHWISSENDANHIYSALIRNEFNSDNITILINSQATYNSIINEFDNLLERVKDGDIVFFHFSGHGQQVTDDDNDELDGLDEAIVPYDSPIDYIPGVYEGERLIRDDILGKYLSKLRAKCGSHGQVVFTIDSCHSGTGTRGFGNSRGTTKIMGTNQFDIIESSDQAIEFNQNDSSKQLSPFVSIFASKASELNFETLDDQNKGVGSLSYSIASVLANSKGDKSFEDFFTEVKYKMKSVAPYQNPQFECEGAAVFMGNGRKRSSNMSIIEEFVDEGNLIANFGTIDGVFKGSSIDIFDKEKKIIGSGTVVYTDLTKSTIRIYQSTFTKKEMAYVSPREKTLPLIKPSVSINLLSQSPWKKSLDNLREKVGWVLNESNTELYIEDCSPNNLLQIFTKNGEILHEVTFSEDNLKRHIHEIKKIIFAFTQGKYLKHYQSNSADFDFNLTVNVVDCQTGIVVKEGKNIGEKLKLKVGECIKIVIENIGAKAGYFSLLDIQPDNMINLIIPAMNLGYTSSEYYLKPGERYETDYNLKIYEPLGEETFKLIASNEALDLSNIIATRGNTTRAISSDHPFEQILKSSYISQYTRGNIITKPKPDELGTVTLFFDIVK